MAAPSGQSIALWAFDVLKEISRRKGYIFIGTAMPVFGEPDKVFLVFDVNAETLKEIRGIS